MNPEKRQALALSWQRVLTALALFVALNRLLASFWSETLMHWIIDIGTVRPAAWIAARLEGSRDVVADGSHLRAPDGSINVLYGCEGTDVLLVLAAALLVAPIPWRRRLAGVLLGAALVFLLNQARVLALFYAHRRYAEWFGDLHGLIAPLVVVVAVVAYFLWWIRPRAAPEAHP